jgi:hypothetical protein
MTSENDIKFTFQCPYMKFCWNIVTVIHFRVVSAAACQQY